MRMDGYPNIVRNGMKKYTNSYRSQKYNQHNEKIISKKLLQISIYTLEKVLYLK